MLCKFGLFKLGFIFVNDFYGLCISQLYDQSIGNVNVYKCINTQVIFFLIIIFVNRQGNIIISDISYKNEV